MIIVEVVAAVQVVKMEVDRGDGKAPEGLNVSKHAVKKLLYEEVKEVAIETRTGNTGGEEDKAENEEMKGEEKEKKEIAWNRLRNNSTLTDLIICIILNGRVMRQSVSWKKGRSGVSRLTIIGQPKARC